MPAQRCTIDSSCVIALDHLGRLPQLSFLFRQVLVPKAVREDLFKRRTTKKRLQAIFKNYDFFERCDDYDKGAAEVLRAEQPRHGSQDRGEIEAVVQASQFGATVIVDDPWGRKLAKRNDLDYHGTLWILGSFHKLGLMSSSDLRKAFLDLRNRGIRLPWKIVDALLVEEGEEPL